MENWELLCYRKSERLRQGVPIAPLNSSVHRRGRLRVADEYGAASGREMMRRSELLTGGSGATDGQQRMIDRTKELPERRRPERENHDRLAKRPKAMRRL